MLKKPAISIIIPVYNSQDYLEECLNSVVRQTLKEIEIICVNDGSTDNSGAILDKFAKKDKRIKVIKQENSGVNRARISGYKKATGKYIAWVDSDDFISETMYERMLDIAHKNASDTVICNYEFYPKKIRRKNKWYKPYTKLNWKFISKNTVQWNKIVKKTLLDELNIVDMFERIGEGCYSFVLMASEKISSIDTPLYFYRVGHESLSSSFDDIDWYIDTVKRNKERYIYAVKHNYNNYWINFLHFQYLYYVSILLIVACRNNDKKTYLECRRLLKKKGLLEKENREYAKEYYSLTRQIFLRYIALNSYFLTKISSRIILR